jgi:hypothetical protein
VSGTLRDLYSVSFSNVDIGSAVGEYGTILRTTNGGTTWTMQTSGTVNDLIGVSFTDANNGTAVGASGTILRTTNGGTLWAIQKSGTTNWLLDVFLSSPNIGVVVGECGTILRTTNGGVSFIEEEQIDEIPTEFLISQNYPNPFNPSTKLSYSITQSSLVTLKVFDVLGSESETLVNEEKTVGNYELNWNAANLPSGVYFYRLQAGEYTSVKKMILLK